MRYPLGIITVFVALALTPLTASAQVLLKDGRVHTVSGEVIEDGNVLIGKDGKIEVVDKVLLTPPGVEVIDCKGKEITPGLIDANTSLGLVEIWAVKGSKDVDPGFKGDLIRSAFQASDGFNPNSVAIPITRSGGVTSVVTYPSGGLVSGQAAWIDLLGESASFGSIVEPSISMRINLGERGASATGGSRGGAILTLRELFDDVSFFQKNAKNFDQNRARTLTASRLDLLALQPSLDGKQPVAFHAHRESDIRAILAFSKSKGIRPIIVGGDEAWRVAKELAASKTPVVLNSMNNLPTRFESLGARADAAAILQKAGVTVVLSSFDSHKVATLRQFAGNAVREGLSHAEALRAITLTPAKVMGMDKTHGSLEVGKIGNVVVWSGDPLELSSRVEHMFINGKRVDLDNRQERLFKKYRTLERRGEPAEPKP